MTVNTINSAAEFDTNGVATVFPFYFKFLADSDLVVTYVDPQGVASVLTLGTNYTVSGAGEDKGGSITTTTVLAGLGKLSVSREMDPYQLTSLRNQGKFLAETHEDVFDRLTMLIQQGWGNLLRALVRPFGRDYYDAENRNISNLADAVAPTDAVNSRTARAYAEQAVAGVVGGFGWFIQAATGAIQRTFQDKMRDIVSVKDFGVVGSGVSSDTAVFQLANNATAPGKSGFVLVPVGTYFLATDVVAAGRTVTFLCAAGADFTGPGKIRANIVIYDAFGARYGITRHAFGSNINGGGLLVGGGAIDEGGQGTFLANDGHANWLRAQTSINYNPTEVVIYGASGQGRAVSVIGGGFVDRTDGTLFDASWVSRPFYFMRQTFLVDSFVSANRLKLKNLNGSAVTFVAASESAFHYVRTTGTGTCSVTGTTIKRISGQPFVPFITYPGYQFRINGTAVSISAFVSGDEMTLSSATGNLSQATFDYELDINAQISTIRIQKTFGHNEENLTISAKATGEYEIRGGGSGSGEDYPIRFYNGHTAPFTPRPVAIISPEGRFGISSSSVFSPSAMLDVLTVRSEPLGSSLYNESARISTVWNNADIRGLELGNFSNGTQGGYLQGRDFANSPYDICLNPRGGNVGVGLNNPVMKLTVAGVIGPAGDNVYTLGQSGARFASVWAANGTIQTSDERLKTDIEDSVLGLDFIRSLRPVSYRFISGGKVAREVVDGYETIDEPVYEDVTTQQEKRSLKVVEGANVLVVEYEDVIEKKQVFDLVENIVDASGNPLPAVRVPRTQQVKRPIMKTVYDDIPGVRLHFGFEAGRVKKAADAAGTDFGGHVVGDDGLQGLRIDEFMAPAVKAITQVDDKVIALETLVQKLIARFDDPA
ncbi:TPA: tail fiber domain-containing protein [Pseudomonas putida]